MVNSIYEVLVLAGDNSCSLPLYDTVRVFIDIRLMNTPPEIVGDLVFNSGEGYYEADIEVGEDINFEISATDADGDKIILRAEGDGFSLTDEGMVFPTDSAFAQIASQFFWTTTCENLEINEAETAFFLDFIAEDVGVCGVKSSQKIKVKLNLIDPVDPNILPEILPESVTFDTENDFYIDTVYLDEPYELPINITDEDGDSLFFEAFADGFSLVGEGMQLPSATGWSDISSTLVWTPTCDNLPNAANGQLIRIFDLTLKGTDYKPCYQQASDSIRLRLVLLYKPDPAEAPQIRIDDPIAFEENGITKVTIKAGENNKFRSTGRGFSWGLHRAFCTWCRL